jgi:hypothetical protein
VILAALALTLPVTLAADVLVMRDGTRVPGELLSVRNGVIELEERRGSDRPRTLRLDRGDVMRIELDSRGDDDFTGGGRPPGLRERQVSVSAVEPWSDAGIEVRAGQTLYFEPSGTVRWGRDRRDGPAGERNWPNNPARPMPNRPGAALIGKVGGGSRDYFFIGDDRGGIQMRVNGRLFLGINDDALGDNSGNFRAVVYN